MKIFLTVFLASVALVASQGYNYQSQQQGLQQQLPQLSQQLPQLSQQLPQLSQQLPQLSQQLPQLSQQLPQLSQQSQYYGPPQSQPLVMQITPSIQLPSSSLIQSPPAISAPAFLSQPQLKTQQSYRGRKYARPRKAIVTKSFFIHSAPEESEDEVQEELAQLSQQPRKHYNVLFIKSPSQTNRATALNFAKALNEEKTVVYVLTKKTTAADLQDAIREVPQKTTKPEVFFIKYRTPEEAANAQRQIQSQYDTLGGTSTISDEGLAPVTSVIGSLDPQVQEEDAAQSQAYEEESGLSNNNGYLPPQY